jgi:hypothetical protein
MGIILWELANRLLKRKYEAPFAEYKFPMDFQIAYQAAEKGVRPTLMSTCPTPWAELIKRCWDKSQDIRPSTTDLLEAINSLYDLYTANPSPWNAAIPEAPTLSPSPSINPLSPVSPAPKKV